MTPQLLIKFPAQQSRILKVTALLVLFTVYPSFAVEKAKEVDQPANVEETVKVELNTFDNNSFEYKLEGRPDPFQPFLTPKIENELNPDEIIDSGEMLTGMQLFEPGQLTLVATLRSAGGFVAMVEDSTGKGYVLNEGMKIGRRGVIVEINSNKVIIEETAVTRSQKVIKTKIDMVLKKEGEE